MYPKALAFYIGYTKLYFQELLESFFSNTSTEFYNKQNLLEIDLWGVYALL